MQEFERCPFGIIGLETAVGLALRDLVHPGKISLSRMVELFSTGPARILNLNAGTLKPGAPADITILDTERVWTYDVNKSHSKSRNSPFHMQEFRGGPVAAIVNGSFAWRLE
jgi:dihydroorotase